MTSLSSIDKYKNPDNWEDDPFDIRSPFQPCSESRVLADAHYFPRDNSGRPSIRNVKDIPAPEYANPSPQLTLKSLEGWHQVCKQSIELVRDNAAVISQWRTDALGSQIDVLKLARQAIKSYFNDDTMNSTDLRQKTAPSKPWQQEILATIEGAFSQNLPTSPEVLYTLYQFAEMNRSIISQHIINKPQKNLLIGRPASSWKFENLVDLCCIPLFNVGMEGIIPGKPTGTGNPTGFEAVSKKVNTAINNCYIVKRILNEVKMVTETELSQFTTTHMSWFLLNPWCLFFTLLRDLMTRKNAEVEAAQVNKSLTLESMVADEDKLEPSSEQLLHRFMEVILILFSILCDERDVFRSTPGRVDHSINVGSKPCNILDDGYVYVCRGGTSGHPKKEYDKNGKYYATYSVNGKAQHEPSDRNRYGHIPIIRYEAKRLAMSSNVHSQIFSELLSAAISNMEYLKISDPKASILPKELRSQWAGVKEPSAPYHDAFVIHMHHYSLTIHTARFPTDYLTWVTDSTESNRPTEHYCILYKVSNVYNLAKPDSRLAAARDILTLLHAIRNSAPTEDGSRLFVARAVMRQSIGGKKESGEKKNMPVKDQTKDHRDNSDKHLKELGKKPTDNNSSRDKPGGKNQASNQLSNNQGSLQNQARNQPADYLHNVQAYNQSPSNPLGKALSNKHAHTMIGDGNRHQQYGQAPEKKENSAQFSLKQDSKQPKNTAVGADKGKQTKEEGTHTKRYKQKLQQRQQLKKNTQGNNANTDDERSGRVDAKERNPAHIATAGTKKVKSNTEANGAYNQSPTMPVRGYYANGKLHGL